MKDPRLAEFMARYSAQRTTGPDQKSVFRNLSTRWLKAQLEIYRQVLSTGRSYDGAREITDDERKAIARETNAIAAELRGRKDDSEGEV